MGIIRLLLALCVVAAHCGPIFGLPLAGAQLAVQTFFIISGFYMSFILNEKYTGVNNSYKLFITNRFTRLFPIYWIVLLLTVLACVLVVLVTNGASAPKFENYQLAKPNLLSYLYLVFSNLFILGQDLAMFFAFNPGSGQLVFTNNYMNSHPPVFLLFFIPQAWTLSLEFMFYLLAPFIVRRKAAIVLVLIVASFLLRFCMYLFWGLNKDPWTFRFFPTELLFFLQGYLSYQIYLIIKERSIARTVYLVIQIFTVLLVALYSFIPVYAVTWFPFTITECVYFLLITLMIPFLFKFLKNNRLDHAIGELSYPVYISHFLVSMVCHTLPFTFLHAGGAVALMTVIFSWILNRYIAVPVDKYRQARLQ